MKNRFVKKLKKKEGLPLTMYYLEKDTTAVDRSLVKMEVVDRINAKGYRIVRYYKPISKI